MINMRDLSVSSDCTRWSLTGTASLDMTRSHSSDRSYTALRDSFTVDLGRRPGAAFAQKMLTYVAVPAGYADTSETCITGWPGRRAM